MGELLHRMADWLVSTVGTMGYPGVFLLMTIESSFIPFPSEVVMVPAGYLASKGEMGLVPAIAVGIAGSLAGAFINYALAVYLGRPFILRYGRYVGISQEKFIHVESYFAKHGEITTFIGRLIPGIRQLISVPAGLGRMNQSRFAAFTALGAGLWVVVLVVIGYMIGENEDLIRKYLREASISLLMFAVIVVAAYLVYQRKRRARESNELRPKV